MISNGPPSERTTTYILLMTTLFTENGPTNALAREFRTRILFLFLQELSGQKTLRSQNRILFEQKWESRRHGRDTAGIRRIKYPLDWKTCNSRWILSLWSRKWGLQSILFISSEQCLDDHTLLRFIESFSCFAYLRTLMAFLLVVGRQAGKDHVTLQNSIQLLLSVKVWFGTTSERCFSRHMDASNL